MSWNVYSNDGQRKYLTKSEIDSFIMHAKNYDKSVYGFCWIMAVTGCRISEALSLGEHSIDFEAKQVIILCLKKRNKRVFRAIPLPQDLLKQLERWMSNGTLQRDKFWPWSRMTAYRRICEIMRGAGLRGSYASPKGLRHGFAVRAIQSNVPLNLVQRWLGHADIKTTAIYTNATGAEERELASRLWSGRAERSPTRRLSSPKRRIIAAEATHYDEATPEAETREGCTQKTADSRQFRPTTERQLNTERSDNDKPQWIEVPFNMDLQNHIGSIPTCRLLHYWLNCNSISNLKTVTYGISPASITA